MRNKLFFAALLIASATSTLHAQRTTESLNFGWNFHRGNADISNINVNDGTVEGMRHNTLPIFSVQYHPEAAPGPDDNMYLFDEFWAMLKKGE